MTALAWLVILGTAAGFVAAYRSALHYAGRTVDRAVTEAIGPDRTGGVVRACDSCRVRYYIPADHMLAVLAQPEWWCERCIVDAAAKEWTA